MDFSCLPIWDVESAILPYGWHASNAPLSTTEEVFEGLQSLVSLNAADGDFCGLFDVFSGPGVSMDHFVQLFLFSTVNNFAGLDGTPAKVIIKFINEHEPLRPKILRHLTTEVSTMSSRAMVEKLLKAAIEAGEAKTVHDLLRLEMVKPDDIVFLNYSPGENPNRLTSVEKAAQLRHLDVVGLLSRFGADVNKTYEKAQSLIERGALECAIGLWGKYRPIDIKLVDLLLNSGAIVSGRLISAAIRWGDEAVVEKLMSKISPSELVHCFNTVVNDAAEYLRNDMSLKLVRQAMQACRDIHNNKCIDSNQRIMAHAMCRAARRNNLELVDLLLPHGGQVGLDSALTAAARFGSHSLVRLLIAHGAHANGQACKLDENRVDTTPLAEAIRRGDDELVALFAEQGAWGQIRDQKLGHLQAALHSIAESGSLFYLLQVLQLVPSPSVKALSPALISAINACHEEIALRLLEAGADPNYRAGSGGPPILAALRIRSQAIIWALLECDISIEYSTQYEKIMEAAIALGDPEIIKALLFIGGSVNICSSLTPPLSLAIKAGNRSVIDLLINLGADFCKIPKHDRQFLKPLDPGDCLSPLAAAALVRDAGTAQYLLDHGADPADERAILNTIAQDRKLLHHILQGFRQRYPQGRTQFGGVVLIHALRTQDEVALDLCLKAGFDVNELVWYEPGYGATALGFAIKEHHSGLAWVSKLLDAGSDANLLASVNEKPQLMERSKISFRQTALLDAIDTRSLPLVELLISRGAQVQKEAKLGLIRTPLQKACEVGSHTIVDLLLSHNADVNEAPAARDGATALQLAAKTGSLRIAKKLLDLGAKMDAPGVRIGGRCAIEYAAEYGRLDMILFLCNVAGGTFAAGQYESAVALARKNGHPVCADLLTELSAKNKAAIDASSR